MTRHELEQRHESERAVLREQTDKLWDLLFERQKTELGTFLLCGQLPCRTPYHCHRTPRCNDGCENVPSKFRINAVVQESWLSASNIARIRADFDNDLPTKK